MIIALCGRAGSGKSAVADALVQRKGWAQVSLADPLKRIVGEVFGWDLSPDGRLYGPSERRNEPDPKWDGLTARHALQQVGTECFRKLHPDVWVRACLREATNRVRGCADHGILCPGVVIPDVRFPNEAAAIRKAGGKLVRIIRPGIVQLDHESEAYADTLDVDLELPNNGELWMLQARASKLPAVLFGGQPFDLETP